MVAVERLAELEDRMKQQARALTQSRVGDVDRLDIIQRLRMLTNALELIRPQVP